MVQKKTIIDSLCFGVRNILQGCLRPLQVYGEQAQVPYFDNSKIIFKRFKILSLKTHFPANLFNEITDALEIGTQPENLNAQNLPSYYDCSVDRSEKQDV